jgi:hypothetical protein
MILSGYAGSNLGHLGTKSSAYIALNLVGGVALSVAAVIASQWGFLLLEGTWAVITLAAGVRIIHSRRSRR